MRAILAVAVVLILSCEPPPPPVANAAPPAPPKQSASFEGAWLGTWDLVLLVKDGATFYGEYRSHEPDPARSYTFQAVEDGGDLVVTEGRGKEWLKYIRMLDQPRRIQAMSHSNGVMFRAEWIGPAAGEGIPAMAEILRNPPGDLTASALGGISAAGRRAALTVPVLVGALKFESRDRVVEKALRSVGRPLPSSLPALQCLLQDDHFTVRQGAAEAIAALGPEASAAVVPLVQALEDGHPAVRFAVMHALSRIGTPALERLRALVLEEEPVASLAALDALRIMGAPARETVTGLATALKPGALRHEANRILDLASKPATRPSEGDWPQWRGPRRDNLSREQNLLQEWPKEGPPTRWSVQGIGQGIGAPSIRGGRVYLLGYIGTLEYVTALDERTGQRLWATPIGSAVTEDGFMRWLCQRTPTVDEEFLYAFRYDGVLACLRLSDGRIRWMKDYRKEFETVWAGWGLSDFPLVDGDRLIIAPGGKKATIVALNKVTGEVLWQSVAPEESGMGHSAIVVAEFGGIRQYIALIPGMVAAFEAEKGLYLGRFGDGRHYPFGLPRATPVVLNDGLLLAPNYTGNTWLRLRAESAGNNTSFTQRRSVSFDFSWCQDSAVVVGSRLYVIGYQKTPTSPQKGNLICVDVDHGTIPWQGKFGSFRSGSLTYADGHLYALGTNGELALIQILPDRCALKSLTRRGPERQGDGATNPVIAGGSLYVRMEDQLYCFDVRAGATKAGGPPVPTTVLPDPGIPRSKDDPLPPAAFVPTPRDIVTRMIDVARVKGTDTVVDLGSGDGRIVIETAKRDAFSVGVEWDATLVRISEENAEREGVQRHVRIKHGDMFKADIQSATVVAVYLPESFLERLKPQFATLKPGTRIVSHQFKIPGVPPDKELEVESKEDGLSHRIYLWTTPLKEPGK